MSGSTHAAADHSRDSHNHMSGEMKKEKSMKVPMGREMHAKGVHKNGRLLVQEESLSGLAVNSFNR